MQLHSQLEGRAAIETELESLASEVAARAVRQAEKEISERVREQFLSSGEAFGSGWLPLKKQPQRHPTLILTGHLMNSFRVLQQSPQEILFGTDAPYAGYSEYGTVHEPRRQILTPELLQGVAVE